jgi:hypothetical protein
MATPAIKFARLFMHFNITFYRGRADLPSDCTETVIISKGQFLRLTVVLLHFLMSMGTLLCNF